jgi:hypothetical protein
MRLLRSSVPIRASLVAPCCPSRQPTKIGSPRNLKINELFFADIHRDLSWTGCAVVRINKHSKVSRFCVSNGQRTGDVAKLMRNLLARLPRRVRKAARTHTYNGSGRRNRERETGQRFRAAVDRKPLGPPQNPEINELFSDVRTDLSLHWHAPSSRPVQRAGHVLCRTGSQKCSVGSAIPCCGYPCLALEFADPH